MSRERITTPHLITMQPPMRLAHGDHDHAFLRFVERWWPWTEAEMRLRSTQKKMAALRLRLEELTQAIYTRAYHVENIPDESQSIWAWVLCGGPNKGRTALMVVSADGTVRTVLPPEAKRPANRRRSR